MAHIEPYTTKAGEKRYVVRWRTADGRRRAQTVPPPRKNAERLKRHLEGRAALGPLYEAPPERLEPFLAGWLSRYENRVRSSTYRRRVEALRPLLEYLPDCYLQELLVADVEDAVSALARRAPRQAQIGLATLKLALRNALERGQVVTAGIDSVRPPRYESRQPVFLTWEQVLELASWMREILARIVQLAALTGAREGELLALRDVDVDLERGVMMVTASADQGRRGLTKTAASRRAVTLPATAQLLIREQLVARSPTGEGLVFPTATGLMWRRDNFMARVFRPAAQRAGLSGLTFHDLRHTCASLMIAAGPPASHPKTIAEQLGHKDGGKLVLERYGHLYPGVQEEAARALDRFVAQAE